MVIMKLLHNLGFDMVMCSCVNISPIPFSLESKLFGHMPFLTALMFCAYQLGNKANNFSHQVLSCLETLLILQRLQSYTHLCPGVLSWS